MEYLLKVSAVIVIFYVCYKVFLERDTFFESNRWFLLLGLVGSFVIPFIVIPIYVEYMPVSLLDFYGTEQVSIENTDKSFSVIDYLSLIYVLGVVFLIIRFFIQLLSLSSLIYKNKGAKKEGFIFVEIKKDTSPFSFFNWIVYNPEKFNQTELEHIIAHEKVHAKQQHSIDILIAQLCCIVLWFNPFVWFYNKDLKKNLEFIADKDTLKLYDCKKSYQYTLLKTSVSKQQMALSNHFYNSLIKKRIVMLQKTKSKKMNQFKYALVLPFLAVFLISCNSETKVKKTDIVEDVKTATKMDNKVHPLVFVDNEELPYEEMEKIDQNTIESMNVLKGEAAIAKYGDKGKNGIIEIIIKNENIKQPLAIIDGKQVLYEELEKLDKDNIESMEVLKNEKAIEKYGDKGKNGVILVTTKK